MTCKKYSSNDVSCAIWLMIMSLENQNVKHFCVYYYYFLTFLQIFVPLLVLSWSCIVNQTNIYIKLTTKNQKTKTVRLLTTEVYTYSPFNIPISFNPHLLSIYWQLIFLRYWLQLYALTLTVNSLQLKANI